MSNKFINNLSPKAKKIVEGLIDKLTEDDNYYNNIPIVPNIWAIDISVQNIGKLWDEPYPSSTKERTKARRRNRKIVSELVKANILRDWSKYSSAYYDCFNINPSFLKEHLPSKYEKLSKEDIDKLNKSWNQHREEPTGVYKVYK